jgi:hypothetical protein
VTRKACASKVCSKPVVRVQRHRPNFFLYFATNIGDSMPRSGVVASLLPGSACAFYLHFFTGIYRASPVKYVICPINKVKIDYRNLQLIIDATLIFSRNHRTCRQRNNISIAPGRHIIARIFRRFKSRKSKGLSE